MGHISRTSARVHFWAVSAANSNGNERSEGARYPRASPLPKTCSLTGVTVTTQQDQVTNSWDILVSPRIGSQHHQGKLLDRRHGGGLLWQPP
ncbi:hypothetical protein L226DRAFT_536012 [Lentinus tigrinus ALCF2SS1-7]|uniref:uncharacterized protein n=1 Tax=Lentinus tigrinus ALCF2SS1-7 TaxID=1328758 RepID=UPI001165E510|nr:hypothetical protein L226DRAFT_536012 [Lentinus tigrinus ALCF2SS1-7]